MVLNFGCWNYGLGLSDSPHTILCISLSIIACDLGPVLSLIHHSSICGLMGVGRPRAKTFPHPYPPTQFCIKLIYILCTIGVKNHLRPSMKEFYWCSTSHAFESPRGSLTIKKKSMHHWEAMWQPSIGPCGLHSLDHANTHSTNQITKKINQCGEDKWQLYIG